MAEKWMPTSLKQRRAIRNELELIGKRLRGIFHPLFDVFDTSHGQPEVAALRSNWSEVAGWSFRRWWVSAPERKNVGK